MKGKMFSLTLFRAHASYRGGGCLTPLPLKKVRQNLKTLSMPLKPYLNNFSVLSPLVYIILVLIKNGLLILDIAHFIKPYRDQVSFVKWISVRFYETGCNCTPCKQIFTWVKRGWIWKLLTYYELTQKKQVSICTNRGILPI